jgi:hypothetical protein
MKKNKKRIIGFYEPAYRPPKPTRGLTLTEDLFAAAFLIFVFGMMAGYAWAAHAYGKF